MGRENRNTSMHLRGLCLVQDDDLLAAGHCCPFGRKLRLPQGFLGVFELLRELMRERR